MHELKKKNLLAERRRRRVRASVKEVNRNNRPRVYFAATNKHLYAQLINDATGKTLMAVSTLDSSIKEVGKSLKNKEYAKKLAKLFVDKMQSKSLDLKSGYVFDRGSRLYHGRVRAFADALRESGLEI